MHHNLCVCTVSIDLAVMWGLHNSTLDESKVILTMEQRNKGEKKSQPQKKECADAFKCLCVKPQALLWLWEANVKPITYFSNACVIRGTLKL